MAKSIEALIADIRLLGEPQYQILVGVRRLIREQFPDATEEVKYGGILFCSSVQFSGVFAYQQHVSVEFSHGAKIKDTIGLLEGKGKGRRHLKLHTVDDIQSKHLAEYLSLALAVAQL